MTTPATCQMHIHSAGLPQRTEVLLERERNAWPSMAASLGCAAGTPLPLALLEQALESDAPARAYTAAFLAGRCSSADSEQDERLARRLEQVADSASEPDLAIEAAMSLVLRGQHARGRAVLEARLHADTVLGDQYKAAFYLAQMGDPSGYGALVATLNSDIAHYRLMALRHAIAFAPWQGSIIGEQRVDVGQLLRERLADRDEMVRSEVPFYMEEFGMPGLRACLEQLELTDPAVSVRIAARMVLERID